MFRPSHSLQRRILAALLLSNSLSLSGCIEIPDLGPAPQPKLVQTYEVENTFRAPAAEWPATNWWNTYGDTQLSGLIGQAIAGAPTLAQVEARFRQAQAIAQQAGSSLLPRVSASSWAGLYKQSYNNGLPAVAVPKGWNDAGQASLNFSYEFDFWGKNRATLAAATSSAEAARADAAAARLTLATGIASTYAELTQLYADRDAAEDALRVRRETAGLLNERLTQGLENQGAVRQAESNRAAAEAELAAIDEAIVLVKNRLAALTGQGPDRGIAIERPQPMAIKPFGLPQNLQADLIGRRPDVVATRLRAEAAAQRINVAKADFYPNVNLTAVLGVQALGIDMLTRSGSDYSSIGPAVSLPIFNGGQLQGAYKESRAEYDAAVAAYEGSITQALNDVADVAASERALNQRLSSSREALAAARQSYQIAQNRYRGGLATYLDVLTAEDSLIANQRNVADLETRAFALDVALVRALGGGFTS